MDDKVYFVLGHGEDYSPTKQTISSVPTNKTLILVSTMGDILTYDAANILIKKYFHTKTGTYDFIRGAKKEKGFRVLTEGQQFIDTVIYLHDKNVWTGITTLPQQEFKEGIFQLPTNMDIPSPQRSPPRKRMSSFLQDNPNEKATYIIFSCRALKGVPARTIQPSGKRNAAQLTYSQQRKLSKVKKEDTRKAPIRKTETIKIRKSKTIKPPQKKRKLSPFSSLVKGLIFTMGRFTPSKTRKTKK